VLTPTLESLLLRLRPRLRRRCEVLASTRPGLEADDLEQEAMVLFVCRAPRWFARPATVSVEAQAWTLLKCCVRNLVTEFDRAKDRTVPLPPGGGEHGEEGATPEIPEPSPEARLVAAVEEAEFSRRLAAVENPTYRLLLKAVYVPRLLGEDDFSASALHRSGGAETFRRSWQEACGLLVVERQRPYATSGGPAEREAWRRFVARCVRFDGDPHDGRDPDAASTQNWLDRNLSRARVALGLAARESQ
jgi:hypothetical protein